MTHWIDHVFSKCREIRFQASKMYAPISYLTQTIIPLLSHLIPVYSTLCKEIHCFSDYFRIETWCIGMSDLGFRDLDLVLLWDVVIFSFKTKYIHLYNDTSMQIGTFLFPLFYY